MTTVYSAEDPDALDKAVQALEQGEIIIYPTDTIYGLGCDATNAESVRKLFELKKRDESKAISVLLPCIESVEEYAYLNEKSKSLLLDSKEPTTVILEDKGELPEILTAKTDSVAIRIPKEGFALELLKKFKKPLTATSANISGEENGSFEDVVNTFPEIPVAIQDEKIESNTKSSRIVDARENSLRVLRN